MAKDLIPAQKNEIVVYQPNETLRLEVRVEQEQVWLNRQQMAKLFGRDVKTIGKHIANALKEELSPTVAKFARVAESQDRAWKWTGLCRDVQLSQNLRQFKKKADARSFGGLNITELTWCCRSAIALNRPRGCCSGFGRTKFSNCT